LKRFSQSIKIVFFLLLGAGLAVFSLRDLSWSSFSGYLRDTDKVYLVLALIIGILSHVSRSMRWQIALKATGHHLTLANSFLAVMIGYFANLVPPRLGEFVRCALVDRYGKIPTQTSLGTVVVERMIDSLMLGIIFFGNFFWQYDLLYSYSLDNIFRPIGAKLSFQTVFVLLVVLFVILFFFVRGRKRNSKSEKSNKWNKIVKGFTDGLKSILTLEKPWMYIIHTLFIWTCYVAMIKVCFLAFPSLSTLNFEACLSVFILGTIGMIVTPGGTGAYPALVAGALALYGVNQEAGNAFGWIVWGTQTFLFIIFGILSLILLPIINRNGI
jgi:uncharacterized protein (TIRG00374 family)